MSLLPRTVAGLLFLATTLTACRSEPCAGPVQKWNRPFVGDGLTVGSVDEAEQYLPFEPIVPATLGNPEQIVVTDRKFLRANLLELMYLHPTYGRFHLLEDRNRMDEAFLESRADQINEVGSAEAGMVPIADEVRGLQVAGCVTNYVTWTQGRVLLDVLGPVATFSPEESLEVARLVVAARSS